MKNIRPLYCMVIVFLLGALGGSISTFIYHKFEMASVSGQGGRHREEQMVKRLDSELGLNAVQREQVRVIVHDSMQEIRSVRRQLRPQIEAIIGKAQQKVNALLTPEQQQKFSRMLAERKERFRNKGE